MLFYDIPYIILGYSNYPNLNLKLYLRLFYFKLIYIISSYVLGYLKSFYFMLL
jgi:hypothetical protein